MFSAFSSSVAGAAGALTSNIASVAAASTSNKAGATPAFRSHTADAVFSSKVQQHLSATEPSLTTFLVWAFLHSILKLDVQYLYQRVEYRPFLELPTTFIRSQMSLVIFPSNRLAASGTCPSSNILDTASINSAMGITSFEIAKGANSLYVMATPASTSNAAGVGSSLSDTSTASSSLTAGFTFKSAAAHTASNSSAEGGTILSNHAKSCIRFMSRFRFQCNRSSFLLR